LKAVVVEIKDGYAALLQNDGRVVKMKNRNFTIGDVIYVKEKTIWRKGRVSAVVAAVAMFMMLLGGGTWAYATPYYTVSLDVNPSIMMDVNFFERVIGFEATNEDAKDILAGLSLKNKNIEEAITQAVARIEDGGYLVEGGTIVIASAAKNEDKAERIAAKLEKAAEKEIENKNINATVDARGIGYQSVQDAKDWDLTPGKYNIITNVLGQTVDERNVDKYKEMTVKQLMETYKEKGVKGIEDKKLRDSEQSEGKGPKDEDVRTNNEKVKGTTAPEPVQLKAELEVDEGDGAGQNNGQEKNKKHKE